LRSLSCNQLVEARKGARRGARSGMTIVVEIEAVSGLLGGGDMVALLGIG